jgi:hypothetical protein
VVCFTRLRFPASSTNALPETASPICSLWRCWVVLDLGAVVVARDGNLNRQVFSTTELWHRSREGSGG